MPNEAHLEDVAQSVPVTATATDNEATLTASEPSTQVHESSAQEIVVEQLVPSSAQDILLLEGSMPEDTPMPKDHLPMSAEPSVQRVPQVSADEDAAEAATREAKRMSATLEEICNQHY